MRLRTRPLMCNLGRIVKRVSLHFRQRLRNTRARHSVIFSLCGGLDQLSIPISL